MYLKLTSVVQITFFQWLKSNTRIFNIKVFKFREKKELSTFRKVIIHFCRSLLSNSQQPSLFILLYALRPLLVITAGLNVPGCPELYIILCCIYGNKKLALKKKHFSTKRTINVQLLNSIRPINYYNLELSGLLSQLNSWWLFICNNNNYYTFNSLSLFWLAESVQWIFEISAFESIYVIYLQII